MTFLTPAGSAPIPVLLNGLSVVRYFFEFIRDPLDAMRRTYLDHGSFVVFGRFLPSMPSKSNILAVGAPLNRAILGNPTLWRTAGIVLRGPSDSAQSRLRKGI